MDDYGLGDPLLSRSKDLNETSSPDRKPHGKYLKYQPDFWNEETTWKNRKIIALAFRKEEKPEFEHAYSGDIEYFKNNMQTQTLTVNSNRLGLTPLIYSIWGEIDSRT